MTAGPSTPEGIRAQLAAALGRAVPDSVEEEFERIRQALREEQGLHDAPGAWLTLGGGKLHRLTVELEIAGGMVRAEREILARSGQACPDCGGPTWREEVDVGVGVLGGPWRCSACAWAEPTGLGVPVMTRYGARLRPG